jgi:NAD(P)-dependent dehydrogenase (short-subunit alcohol dehydrogenase family)
MGNPVALVTGVSSGIGNATAQALVERGYRVFGTARSEASAVPAKVERVLLDVRDAASIDAGVREVLAKAGRIDLLVNNAGGSMIGAIEETSLEQARELFDLNFFGAVRMTQAVLPAMRAQKSGRIVFISSVVGFLPAPFMGFYAASKHALEGLAESLDHETRTLGIRVALVEPGFTRTNIGSNRMLAASRVDDYAAARDRAGENVRALVSAGDDPRVVAEAVLEAATAEKPRLRYPAGKRAVLLARLRRYLPASIFDGALRKQFRLDSAGGSRAPVA